jgi:hypothetical protein
MSDDRDVDVDHAFTQLDAALCLRSVAIGEQRAKQYFDEVTPSTRRVVIDGKAFLVAIMPSSGGEKSPSR